MNHVRHVPHYSAVKDPEVPDGEKSLREEMARLSNQQSEELQIAIFLPFTLEKATKYDARAKRIGEIRKLLGEV